MSTITILLLAMLAISFFILYRRKIKKEQLQHLKNLSAVAREKEGNLLVYISQNLSIFYNPEDLVSIRKMAELYEKIILLIKKNTTEFSNENIAKDVNEAIDEAKRKAGIYVDMLGMHEQLARIRGNALFRMTILQVNLAHSMQAVEVKRIWFLLLFSKLLPEHKSNVDLIKKINEFLKGELALFELSEKYKQLDSIEVHLPVLSAVLENVPYDENIAKIKPLFNRFLNAS